MTMEVIINMADDTQIITPVAEEPYFDGNQLSPQFSLALKNFLQNHVFGVSSTLVSFGGLATIQDAANAHSLPFITPSKQKTFVCNTSGTYVIRGTCTSPNGTSFPFLQLYKNGSQVGSDLAFGGSSTQDFLPLVCTAGDTIDIYGYFTGSNSCGISDAQVLAQTVVTLVIQSITYTFIAQSSNFSITLN